MIWGYCPYFWKHPCNKIILDPIGQTVCFEVFRFECLIHQESWERLWQALYAMGSWKMCFTATLCLRVVSWQIQTDVSVHVESICFIGSHILALRLCVCWLLLICEHFWTSAVVSLRYALIKRYPVTSVMRLTLFKLYQSLIIIIIIIIISLIQNLTF